jgi:zinc transporter
MDNEREPDGKGLICAFDLDGRGGGRELDWPAIRRPAETRMVRWVHLDHSAMESRDWLGRESGLDPSIVDALLEMETRPRCLQLEKGFLLVMRGVNLNPDASFEDMVSVRVWVDSDRIITTRRRQLRSVQQIRNDLRAGNGPCDQSEFLRDLIAYLGDNIAGVIEGLDDAIDAFEEAVECGATSGAQGELGGLRRKTAYLRRFLAPQREALERLSRAQSALLTAEVAAEIYEQANRMILFVEELDLARERAMVAREEMISNLAQDQNSKMYLLSLVAAIFLPLSFITGMMGMNTAGLPGSENPIAFWVVAGMMLLLGIGILLVFRLKRWM